MLLALYICSVSSERLRTWFVSRNHRISNLIAAQYSELFILTYLVFFTLPFSTILEGRRRHITLRRTIVVKAGMQK